MKRKPGDRPGWRRIRAHRYTVARGAPADGGYVGIVSLYSMLRVAEPLWKPLHGQPALLAGDGFAWLQFYPDVTVMAHEATYVATAMIAPDGALAQWYVDVCENWGLTPEGIPWHDDLYLDLISSGREDVEIIDAADLEAALAEGAISVGCYHATWRAAHTLAPALRRGALPEFAALRPALAALRALEAGAPAPGYTLLYRALVG